MNGPVLCVVGHDATMVYDALHSAVSATMGDLDPLIALQDFTAKDVTTSSGDSIIAKVIEALNTPPFLVERRVIVVRDAQSLLADEVAELLAWISSPVPDIVLVLAVVGAKSHKLVKASSEVIDANVGSRSSERVSFVESKLQQYEINVDARAARAIASKVGDDVARVDALARTLQAIYGTTSINMDKIEPYLGDLGDVPEWDLTDALDSGDSAKSIEVARRMLDSKGRAALQIVNMLQRHYLRMARLEGSAARGGEDAALLVGIGTFPAGKALAMSQRLGATRIATAVHWITEADGALKGAVSYGGKDLNSDMDVTELTVIEVLVARLARMTSGARRS